jgi:hypothetical protein
MVDWRGRKARKSGRKASEFRPVARFTDGFRNGSGKYRKHGLFAKETERKPARKPKYADEACEGVSGIQSGARSAPAIDVWASGVAGWL